MFLIKHCITHLRLPTCGTTPTQHTTQLKPMIELCCVTCLTHVCYTTNELVLCYGLHTHKCKVADVVCNTKTVHVQKKI